MFPHSKRVAFARCAVLFAVAHAVFAPAVLKADSNPGDPSGGADSATKRCAPQSGGDLLLCVLRNHPDLQAGLSDLKALEAQIRRADQPVNPRLESRVLGGDSSLTAEAALTHTFETGGKRDARVAVARENLAVARSRLLLNQQRLVAWSALRLMRLRQVREDAALLKESGRTYARAVARMRSRPALSAEQRVNLATYEFAVGETQSHRAALQAEEAALRADLEFATGMRGEELERALDVAVEATEALRWPAPDAIAAGPAASAEAAELRVARNRIARARALVELEEALAFPDFSIGPAFEYSRRDSNSGGLFGGRSGGRSGGSEAEFGLSFRVTLPLYHRNAGGREAARETLEAERLKESGVATRTELERRRRAAEYRLAFDALRSGFSEKQIETRLRGLRATIRGGRVSPPAVIEFYRSLFEFHHARHDQEFAAMRALLAIHVLDGRLLQMAENNEIF